MLFLEILLLEANIDLDIHYNFTAKFFIKTATRKNFSIYLIHFRN